jgi:hypothetical protein
MWSYASSGDGIVKKIIIVGGLLCAVLIAIFVWLQRVPFTVRPPVRVQNVRQPETIVLGQKTGKHVHGLTVHGIGDLDGEAAISLMVNGQPYRSEDLKGKVDFKWDGDYYSETAEFRYEPKDVRGGNVELHYEFHSDANTYK